MLIISIPLIRQSWITSCEVNNFSDFSVKSDISSFLTETGSILFFKEKLLSISSLIIIVWIGDIIVEVSFVIEAENSSFYDLLLKSY